MASVRSRPPGPTLVPGVFIYLILYIAILPKHPPLSPNRSLVRKVVCLTTHSKLLQIVFVKEGAKTNKTQNFCEKINIKNNYLKVSCYQYSRD